jgi:hypothetical protein
MPEDYDTSWDLIESNKGYLSIEEDTFERRQEFLAREGIRCLVCKQGMKILMEFCCF